MSRLTPRTRLQVKVFAVLAAVTVGYSATAYLDVGKQLGLGYYDLSVQLPDGAGLYPGSIVTLSGVQVGQVTSMETSPERVVAKLRIENDADIPKSVHVEVRSISAAGEQYLDIADPTTTGTGTKDAKAAGMYKAGDTIPVSAASVPIQTAELLAQVDDLVKSVPVEDLNTTLDELGAGLSDGAQDMTKFLNAILPLQEKFTSNLDPTQQLIANGEPVLQTQQETKAKVAAATKGLAEFTQKLQESDGALRNSLESAPALTEQVTGLVNDLGPTLPGLLNSLTQVGEVTSVYDPAIRHILTMVPVVVNGFQTAMNVSPVKGAVSLFARAVVNHPPPCTDGFVQERRSPRDTTPIAPPTKVYCDVKKDSGLAVRGARNYPCPNNALRGPSASSCGLQFQSKKETQQVEDAAIATQVARAKGLAADAKADTVPYDPLSGLAMSSDGPLFILGSALTNGPASDNWQSLLLGPLGLS